jgi:transposase-like protein
MTVLLPVLCPNCHSSDIIRHGKSAEGKQRYLCRNADCLRRSFVLETEQPGRKPEIKQKIVDMALNGSGVRDTARVLHVSPATVIRELKKNYHNSNK